MKCRKDIECMFKEKSRGELLDFVCEKLDKNSDTINYQWELIGKISAYVESDLFKDLFENEEKYMISKNYIDNMIKKLETYPFIEDYKQRWRCNYKTIEQEQKLMTLNTNLSQKRIDEAIKYINSQMDSYEENRDFGVDCCCDGFELLSILKGEQMESKEGVENEKGND